MLRWAWRYSLGFCPKCNSDAPELYKCSVCDYKKEPYNNWWGNYLKELI